MIFSITRYGVRRCVPLPLECTSHDPNDVSDLFLMEELRPTDQ